MKFFLVHIKKKKWNKFYYSIGFEIVIGFRTKKFREWAEKIKEKRSEQDEIKQKRSKRIE